MRKLLLSLSALLVSAALNAQAPVQNSAKIVGRINLPQSLAGKKGNKIQSINNKQNMKIAQQQNNSMMTVSGNLGNLLKLNSSNYTLADNQQYMETYKGEDYLNSAVEVTGISSFAGQSVSALAFMSGSDITKYYGGKVVAFRFALSEAATVSEIDLYGVTSSGQVAVMGTQSITGQSKAGWNDVTLTNPVVLDTSKYVGFLFGYTYTQGSGNTMPISFNNDAENQYPTYLVVGGGLGELGGVYNLSIKAVVEKDYAKKDLNITGAVLPSYFKKGSPAELALIMHNDGTQAINKYQMSFTLDDKTVLDDVYTNSKAVEADGNDTIDQKLNLPADITEGPHFITAKLTTVDGEAPAGDVTKDAYENYFFVYSNTTSHQKQFVEHYTSQQCMFCIEGEEFLQTLKGLRANNDFAEVALHGIQNPSDSDQFYTANFDTLAYVMNVTGYPSASFNRLPLLSSLAESLGIPGNYVSPYANIYNQALEYQNTQYPAFVNLDLRQGYDPTTRKYTLVINGKGVENAHRLFAEPGVVAYLTEDSLVAKQLNSSKLYQNSYVHNAVMRQVLSNSILGDTITWNGDNFTKTYTLTIPSTYNVNNLHAVVGFGEAVDLNYFYDEYRMGINQADKLDLKDAPTSGISNINRNSNVREVVRYNALGQRVNDEQKGLNIVRLSNGKVVKYLVK